MQHPTDQPAPPARPTWSVVWIGLLAGWTTLTVSFILAVALLGAKPNTRAVLLMGCCLALLWCLVGGLLQRCLRDRFRAAWQALPLSWPVKFVLTCTALALVEEAITVTLTNAAPLFGVAYGAAYITASGNYLDVVCRHSVVVFVPMFICWAWLLARYDFHPNTVLICFGLTGTLAEISFGGLSALVNLGFWSFVYGLMVYLPAYSLPERPGLRTPRPWHYLLAVFLPFVFVIPVAGPIAWLHPIKIHFPPIPPNS